MLIKASLISMACFPSTHLIIPHGTSLRSLHSESVNLSMLIAYSSIQFYILSLQGDTTVKNEAVKEEGSEPQQNENILKQGMIKDDVSIVISEHLFTSNNSISKIVDTTNTGYSGFIF